MNTDTAKLIVEATERLQQEAYVKGWRDAIEAMNRAVKDLGEPAMPEGVLEMPAQQAEPTNGGLINRTSGPLPKVGTTPHYILTAVRRAPGLTGGQIIESVRNDGLTAPETSIRTNIQRLKDRKLLFLRHGKWYPN